MLTIQGWTDYISLRRCFDDVSVGMMIQGVENLLDLHFYTDAFRSSFTDMIIGLSKFIEITLQSALDKKSESVHRKNSRFNEYTQAVKRRVSTTIL